MRKIALLASLILAAAPALAAPAPVKPQIVPVRMQDRTFRPQVIRMKGGVPTRIVLTNRDRTAHDFYAPDFFNAARINGRGVGALDKNRLTVRSGETRAITVIPRPGHYDLKSSKALDVASGMQGQILVY
jgi:plastocyanin